MPLSKSIASRLRYQLGALPDIIGGLTEQELRHRVDPEKWSAFEQITHLAAYQPTFLHRLERLKNEHAPVFQPYVAANDPAFQVCLEKTLPDHLDSLAANAAVIADVLEKFSDAQLLNWGIHMKYGKLDVTQWTEFYLLHEAHHLFAIFMLAQDLRAARG